MLGPGVPRSARRRCVGRPPRPVSRAWPGPDRGRMAGLHPPRWTIRNRQRWPPRGPARRDGRQWASRGGRGVRGGAGRVLTVSLLMAPAGGSGRRHACLARTPPPWATRCGGRREGPHGLPAGPVQSGGRVRRLPRRAGGRRGGEAQAGTLRLSATALDHDTPLRPTGWVGRLGTRRHPAGPRPDSRRAALSGRAGVRRPGRQPATTRRRRRGRRNPDPFATRTPSTAASRPCRSGAVLCRDYVRCS